MTHWDSNTSAGQFQTIGFWECIAHLKPLDGTIKKVNAAQTLIHSIS
jgi:hypothetical protein